jgi:hypothetical protein
METKGFSFVFLLITKDLFIEKTLVMGARACAILRVRSAVGELVFRRPNASHQDFPLHNSADLYTFPQVVENMWEECVCGLGIRKKKKEL